MRYVGGVVMIAALCALPAAHGDTAGITISIRHAMTPIGSTPTKAEIAALFPFDTVERLSTLALDPTEDFGVRLRAIRALPDFCLPTCAGTPAHTALLAVLAVEPETLGKTILLQRATIEALGVAKSPGDVETLVSYLANASRDIRAATAFALLELCQPEASDALHARYAIETVMQVKLALFEALNTCSK